MRKRAICLAIAVISFLCLMMLGHFFLRPSNIKNVQTLNDGWNARYNDTEFTDVKLSDLRGLIGSATKRGDRIVLSRQLDNLNTFMAPTIFFEARFSAWEVYCNHLLISEHFLDMFESGRFIGCENCMITLPTYNTPVVLEIKFLVAEDGAYNYYESPSIGSYTDILHFVVYNNLFIFLCSAFLIIFGLLFFTISVGFRSALPEVDMQIYSSLLFIMLGIWFLTQFKLLDLFLDVGGRQTELEYISLYMLTPLMYMVMGSMQDYLKKKRFLFFAISSFILAIVPIIIHYAGIKHINQMLIVSQLNALVLYIFMILMLIRDKKDHRITPSQLIQLMGQIALAASFGFNVFFYYLEVNGISEQIMLSKKAVPMGAMCMVFATLVNYQLYISESFARHKEYASLARLAYADGLTDIANRSKYEKYLSDLDKTDEDYCIISLDLNGLKTINDRKGHLMGDKYLIEFSNALSEIFNEKGFIARIGGDEFVVVLKDKYLGSASEMIDALNNKLEELNSRDHSFKRSTASGVAYKHEATGEDWNSVYLLADERMYKTKAKMHKDSES